VNKKILILLTIIISSCTSSTKDSNPLSTYENINTHFGNLNQILQTQIKEQISDLIISDYQNIKQYDRLTNDYIDFLNIVESNLFKNIDFANYADISKEFENTEYINDVFFKENLYSNIGHDFIKKTSDYKDEISKLINDKYFLEKINTSLNTNDIINFKHEKIKYLDYLYRDKSLIATLSLLRIHMHTILEFENEFILQSKNQIQSKEKEII